MTLQSAAATPCIYVHLTTGDVEEFRPADTVRVGSETVEVLFGEQQVARFVAREVLFCSHADVSPFPCS